MFHLIKNLNFSTEPCLLQTDFNPSAFYYDTELSQRTYSSPVVLIETYNVLLFYASSPLQLRSDKPGDTGPMAHMYDPTLFRMLRLKNLAHNQAEYKTETRARLANTQFLSIQL